ncbi:hypothetical protein C0J52_27839 [Blattella germanica]|nr:hypothetical protein C0J52_27839 [Blattella germanica]
MCPTFTFDTLYEMSKLEVLGRQSVVPCVGLLMTPAPSASECCCVVWVSLSCFSLAVVSDGAYIQSGKTSGLSGNMPAYYNTSIAVRMLTKQLKTYIEYKFKDSTGHTMIAPEELAITHMAMNMGILNTEKRIDT